MNREAMIAERVATNMTAKTQNLRELLSEINDLYMQAQDWEKRAKIEFGKETINALEFKRVEKFTEYLEGAWVTLKAILDSGKWVTLKTGSSHVSSKWPTVKAMRADLNLMLDQFEEWLEKEKAAVEDGTARFDNRSYYQAAFDAIEEADEKMKKVEKYL
jgi:hypothetical protein